MAAPHTASEILPSVETSPSTNGKKSVCLAILNYNGRKHLEHLLPSALKAANAYEGLCSILVLDNRSTKDDVDWMKAEFPSVRVVVAADNDYLFSYNWLLPQLEEELVVLLNNDLRVEEHFLEPLVRHFTDSDLFSVSASSYDWEGNERTIGPVKLTYANGFYDWSFQREHQELSRTLFASGGFMAVDRNKFLELGGFNRLYYPAYCEDLDLGFRSWRRGWRSLYEPESVVWHREGASWGAKEDSNLNALLLRNSLLFQWASLPMEKGRMIRSWSFCKIILRDLLQGKTEWMRTCFRTWREWRKIKNNHASLKTSQRELASIQHDIMCSLELKSDR